MYRIEYRIDILQNGHVQIRYITEWTCTEYKYYKIDMYKIDILQNGHVQNIHITEWTCTEYTYYRMDMYIVDILQNGHVQNRMEWTCTE